MITIDIGGLIALMGLPAALTGFCFWLIEHRIQKREKERDKAAEEQKKKEEQAAAERRKKIEEQEEARKKLELLLIQSNGAAVALAEATAKAVQRIPDAKCNGDMHAALDYAAAAKHELKNFLSVQGVAAIFE